MAALIITLGDLTHQRKHNEVFSARPFQKVGVVNRPTGAPEKVH